MAKYNSQGWHFQKERHSQARKTGKAGGQYANSKNLSVKMTHTEPKSQIRYKSTQLFKFDELSKEAKQKAINKWRDEVLANEPVPFLEEDLENQLEEELSKNKIKETGKTELGYSLGYSQGDGASFTGNFEWKGYDVKISRNNSHYFHERSTNIDISKEGEDAKPEVYEDFKKKYYDICKKIEKAGYEEIEYRNSDESIAEDLRANDYDFNTSGGME
jgi:hypothetical protein